MKTQLEPNSPNSARPAFTLVEMLVVIAIISILMTLGSIGLSSIGGKGVAGGVSTAEALFDEARNNAVGRGQPAAVLVAKTLTNSPADDLRRVVVAYKDKAEDDFWILGSRGALLPEKTFFSERFSKQDHPGGAAIEVIDSSALRRIAGTSTSPSPVGQAYQGKWFIYRFNGQGICTTPGASFIIGSGARALTKSSEEAPPRTSASAKRDFGGFVIWRNGRTSVFRSPGQMGADTQSGDTF